MAVRGLSPQSGDEDRERSEQDGPINASLGLTWQGRSGFFAGADTILGITGWRWVFLINVPVGALIMLAGIYYGAQYGGSTTAILVNIPGESSAVVTTLDGYQMARQGRAGVAHGGVVYQSGGSRRSLRADEEPDSGSIETRSAASGWKLGSAVKTKRAMPRVRPVSRSVATARKSSGRSFRSPVDVSQ